MNKARTLRSTYMSSGGNLLPNFMPVSFFRRASPLTFQSLFFFFVCVFAPFSKDFKGSAERKILAFFSGSSLFLPQKKKNRIGRSGSFFGFSGKGIYGNAGSFLSRLQACISFLRRFRQNWRTSVCALIAETFCCSYD